jgi:hypothetical protein
VILNKQTSTIGQKTDMLNEILFQKETCACMKITANSAKHAVNEIVAHHMPS